jgi:hypothetical protein
MYVLVNVEDLQLTERSDKTRDANDVGKAASLGHDVQVFFILPY